MYAKENKKVESMEITSGLNLNLKDDGQETKERKIKKQKRINILNGYERDKFT